MYTYRPYSDTRAHNQGRLFGSQHHSIMPFKAAIAAVHLILVPLYFLSSNFSQPVRYGAHTDRWGNEYVGLTPVKEWDSHKEEGQDLIRRCDALYKSFKEEVASREFERAREHM